MTDSGGDPVGDIELVELDVKQAEEVKEKDGLEEGECVVLPDLETDGVTL